MFVLTNQDSDTGLSPKILKSIDKEIKKNWKDVDVLRKVLVIDDNIAKSLQLDIGNLILLNGTDTLAYIFVRRTNGCVIGGCSNNSVNGIDAQISNNFGERYEHFDYMAILNKDLSVKKVKVLVYDGGYSYEIVSKLWLKQFIGYFEGDLKYGKDIQAISGATVSAQSITDDIQLLVQSAKKLRALGEI